MKRYDIFRLTAAAFAVIAASSCTDLTEKVYDQVMSQNYYNTKSDIIRAVFRPFEHVYCCEYDFYEHEELTGDHFITPTRGTWWYDGGKWETLHRHTWTNIDNGWSWTHEWDACYMGIGQCNLVLDDLSKLDPAKFGLSEDEFDGYRGQLRTMRAFLYLRLLNTYRNCILTTTSDEAVNNLPENRKQVSPQTLFDFIESELKISVEELPAKTGSSGPGNKQGSFTKGAAAALLVRLYLNAEKWIGTAHYEDVISWCGRIRNGEFGTYTIAENWWEPFDWNNETCDEVIFGFPGSYTTSSWHMQNSWRTFYGRTLPFGSANYLGVDGNGERNPKYALSPSYDNSNPRKLFTFKLGMPSQKFQKYPGDKRWKQYKNTSVNSREGMFFLEGKIPNATTYTGYAMNPEQQYVLYLRDQVGQFLGTAEEGLISGSGKESKLGNGDFNSGLYCVKYPFYSFTGGYYIESDLTEIRYAEIYYSEAEALLRTGKADEAGKLLNFVRKRNYEDFNSSIAYEPEGSVKLDLDEMLDEWGREFIEEGRRRTDLIRFGRFQDEWWDKPKDADSHFEIYPISRQTLEQNRYLHQNPGYEQVN
ncbi:MAG: RagB/SusD family nutrient uptake outer membrane protein [Rikenellaceae bacterium]|nr:RagB/SusD family nutrient uptake outer membrane protein [Rikenellaceae bacterium]